MTRSSGFLLFLLLFVISFLPPLSADPIFKFELSAKQISFEEKAVATLTIEWPSSEGGYSFAIPDLPLKNLILTNQSNVQESFVKGNDPWNRKIFTFELAPQAGGEGRINEFAIGIVNPARPEAPKEYLTPLLTLQAAKPKVRQQKILRLSNLIISVSVGLLVGFFLRKKQKKEIPKEITPKEAAAFKMKETVGKAEKFSSQSLKEIDAEFRQFLKEFYGVSVKQSETEILEGLKAQDLIQDEYKKIERILNRLAEVKYTGTELRDFDFQFLKREILELSSGKLVAGVPAV